MEPRIQYARRPDGARTAYAVAGSGPVLIVPPGMATHIEWYYGATDAQRRFCARLAEKHRLVLYDRHGCGLSDRNRTDFTPEDDMSDLETVIAAVGANEIAMFGISWGGNPVLAYAARQPERVRRIILYGAFADGPRRAPDAESAYAALSTLRRMDFETYLRAEAAHYFPSGADPEMFRSLVQHLRDATTVEMAEKLETVRFDNQSLLPQITVPALVLNRRGDLVNLFDWGRYTARRLPNAQFVPLEGDAHYPWVGDAESVLRPTLEFLADERDPAPASTPAAATHDRPSGTAVILFADIADSTALTERIGDAAFREKTRELDDALRSAITDAGGTTVEGRLLGDGVLATFTSAKDAIDGALRCARAGDDCDMPLHLGVHAGDVIRERGDIHGGAVNIAARVSDAAVPGEVLVSDIVRGLARTSAGMSFEDRGEHHLKGIADPVRLYAVRPYGG